MGLVGKYRPNNILWQRVFSCDRTGMFDTTFHEFYSWYMIFFPVTRKLHPVTLNFFLWWQISWLLIYSSNKNCLQMTENILLCTSLLLMITVYKSSCFVSYFVIKIKCSASGKVAFSSAFCLWSIFLHSDLFGYNFFQ